MGLGVALKRASFNGSELSAVAIRAVLFADVLADPFQFKSHGGDGVTPGPEVFTREIPFPCRTAGQWQSHSCLFENLAFLLVRQTVENWSQLTAGLPEDHFPPPLGHEYNVVLAVPFGMA